MSNQVDGRHFDKLYRDEEMVEGLPTSTPWDIGGPQQAVQQLVAFGGLRGEVLDPGTGPGHHAIHYASKGYAATGIDSSAAAIERAKRNAARAGVTVTFTVADATRLDGLENRFDTVVDSAFYHLFLDDEEMQGRYTQALHRATRPGARLFMFEFGRHNINGLRFDGLPAENFQRVLPATGWRIDYLGETAFQTNLSPQTVANMDTLSGSQAMAERMKPVQQRLPTIAPLLDDHLVHMPVWTVVATRQ